MENQWIRHKLVYKADSLSWLLGRWATPSWKIYDFSWDDDHRNPINSWENAKFMATSYHQPDSQIHRKPSLVQPLKGRSGFASSKGPRFDPHLVVFFPGNSPCPCPWAMDSVFEKEAGRSEDIHQSIYQNMIIPTWIEHIISVGFDRSIYQSTDQ